MMNRYEIRISISRWLVSFSGDVSGKFGVVVHCWLDLWNMCNMRHVFEDCERVDDGLGMSLRRRRNVSIYQIALVVE